MDKVNAKPRNFENENRTPSQSRTLVNVDLYLKNGIHIGTKYKNGPMRKFVFKSRNDKINVMDVQIIDKRIKIAIDFISKYEPTDVVFISRKKYALPGVKILEQAFGYKSKLNRFIPGTFTNPESEHFIEPKLVFIADPNVDRQAVVESTKANIPIVALCTTSSNTRNIDLIVPYNNKGRKSVALFFWLLIRELELRNGIIKSDKDYAYSIDDLVYNSENGEKEMDEDQPLPGKRVRKVSTKATARKPAAGGRRPSSTTGSAPRRPYVRRTPLVAAMPIATAAAPAATTAAPTVENEKKEEKPAEVSKE
ncbi:MAG TPA: 30S ribosomal protein S2 [archaeon]|jgi:small subunit ribosomal protein S2|nr:30S ribosomal protein S2 [archaeon]